MTFRDLLAADRIILGLQAADKAQALDGIARRAGSHVPLAAATILAALETRERSGSTGFGRGFALPHVRLPGLPELLCFLVRLARPVPFDAIDGKPVDVLVLMLIPEDATAHADALAAVSRAMRDDAVLRAIRHAGSPAALLAALPA